MMNHGIVSFQICSQLFLIKIAFLQVAVFGSGVRVVVSPAGAGYLLA
jgi:hypothetical protein